MFYIEFHFRTQRSSIPLDIMVLKIYSFSEIPSADIQWLTFQFSDPGPWFILYLKKALENPYKIAVQDIEKVTSSSLRVLPNLVRWFLEYPII